MKSRILDLFCCEGGMGAGYRRAGWIVYGVDTEARFAKRYPGDAFWQEDALGLLETLVDQGMAVVSDPSGKRSAISLRDLDAIHASPPCQGYSRGNAGKKTAWPRLIPEVRTLLERTGKPYVIENVKDAGPEMVAPVGLCGCMFDMQAVDTDGVVLHLQRLRLFETNWGMTAPRACDHSTHEWVAGAYGGARRDKYEARYVRKGGYVPPDKGVVKALLGVEHDMTWNGLFECVPPRYAEHIGSQLMEHLGNGPEAAISDRLCGCANGPGIWHMWGPVECPRWLTHLSHKESSPEVTA